MREKKNRARENYRDNVRKKNRQWEKEREKKIQRVGEKGHILRTKREAETDG